MEKDIINEMNLVDARPYLKEFQKMTGINETGELDVETMEMMNKPRCGCLDMESPMHPRRSRGKRFAHNGRRWNKRDLTYRITRYPGKCLLECTIF